MSSRDKDKHGRRTRVGREKVRSNAREGDRGPSFFRRDVRTWRPQEKGTVDLDVLPYEVKCDDHPDDVKRGSIWYKRPFKAHRGIGPENKSYVCPLSVGKPCPIHEDYVKLSRKGKVDEDVLRQLRGQDFVAMNIVDPDDKDEVAVYADSVGKFWSADAGLSHELDEGDEENAAFFDVKGGKTLHCRFSEKSFKTSRGDMAKFIAVTKIDFRDRKDMNEDEVLERTVDLDAALQVLPYDKLRELYLQGSAAEGSSPSSDEEEDSSASSSSSASSESSSASSSGSKPDSSSSSDEEGGE